MNSQDSGDQGSEPVSSESEEPSSTLPTAPPPPPPPSFGAGDQADRPTVLAGDVAPGAAAGPEGSPAAPERPLPPPESPWPAPGPFPPPAGTAGADLPPPPPPGQTGYPPPPPGAGYPPPPPPPPAKKTSTIVYFVIAGVCLIAVVIVVILAAGVINNDSAAKSLNGIAAGDCFNAPKVGSSSVKFEKLDCAKAHQFEAVTKITGPADFPGADGLREYAAEACLPPVSDYVGPNPSPDLAPAYFYPSSASLYASTNHQILCAVGRNGQAKGTGSVHNGTA